MGAYGGRAELMEQLSPLGPIYQAGTFCGNPVTMKGGIAALKAYRQTGFYEHLDELTTQLGEGLQRIDERICYQKVAGMFSIGFGVDQLRDHDDALRLDSETFSKFFHSLLEAGIYLPPSTWDAAAVSSAHTRKEIDLVLERVEQAWKPTT